MQIMKAWNEHHCNALCDYIHIMYSHCHISAGLILSKYFTTIQRMGYFDGCMIMVHVITLGLLIKINILTTSPDRWQKRYIYTKVHILKIIYFFLL